MFSLFFLLYQYTTLGSIVIYGGFTGQQFEASCGADGRWEVRDPHDFSPVDCGAAPTIEKSVTARVSGTTYGHVAVYECLEDFTHTGPSLKTCEANQHWSSYIVECAPENSVSCGDPPTRDHADVMFESRAAGATARYSCIAGYTGSDTGSVCQTDGQWSEPDILWEPVYCDLPSAVLNSHISVTDFRLHLGRSVVHACNPGFTSSSGAPLESTCLDDGTRSLPGGLCHTVQVNDSDICGPTVPLVSQGQPSIEHTFHVGSVLKYTCDPCYYPVPPSEYFAHTCQPCAGLTNLLSVI